MTFFVLNQDSKISNSNNTNEWQDTESNRRADQVAGVAARVNGKPIMLSQVDKLISQQLEGKQSNLSPVELKQARLQMLDNMIQQEVLYQRAEREKLLPTDAEIDQFINTQMQQSQMTQEDLDKRLKETGQTKETLREETKRTLAIQKLQERTNSKIMVSDNEVDDYYDKNKELFINKRGVDLAAIFSDPADNGMRDDAKGDEEARQKIEQIYGQLQNGAQFEDVARAKSEDTNSNASGGDIGFATEAELKQKNFPAKLIDDLLNKMAVGSYSAPVNFSNKWYIFKLKSRQLQEENLNLESPGVRQQVTDVLIKQRKELANAALLTTATNEAKIVNYLAASNTTDQK